MLTGRKRTPQGSAFFLALGLTGLGLEFQASGQTETAERRKASA